MLRYKNTPFTSLNLPLNVVKSEVLIKSALWTRSNHMQKS